MIISKDKFYNIHNFAVLDDFGNFHETARYIFSCVLTDKELENIEKHLLLLKSNNIDIFLSDNKIVFLFDYGKDKPPCWSEYNVNNSIINTVLPELKKKINYYMLLK